MRGLFLIPALLAVSLGSVGSDADAPWVPRVVNIVAACTGGSPRVEPSQVRINFADNVEWRATGQVTSFAITPKDTERWPFPRNIAGNPQTPASSGLPPTGTPVGTYLYYVVISCPDGSTQVIDPEIIIGAG